MSEVLGMLQQPLNQISTDNQLVLGKVAVIEVSVKCPRKLK